MNKFQIGDTAYYAKAGRYETQTTCPDCDGTRRIRLILANNEQVSIDCGGCARGYEGSHGTISEYKFKAEIESFVIGGVNICTEKTQYSTDRSGGHWYTFDEKDVFITRKEAEDRCKELIEEAVTEERNRLLRKEKDTRSWAWNASYHRKQIKQAQKDLTYHTAKLNVAAFKAQKATPAKQEGR